MKKVNKLFNITTLTILSLVIIGICGTYLSDYLIEINWFGDYTSLDLVYGGEKKLCKHWGARHYWYNWGVFLLMTVSVFRYIGEIINIGESKEDEV